MAVANTVLDWASTCGRTVNTLLDPIAPGRIYRAAGRTLTFALALATVGTARARPQGGHGEDSVHTGGGYITAAEARWREVRQDIRHCVTARGGQSWPADNVVAHCMAKQAAASCAQDAACQTAIDRSLALARQGVATASGEHSGGASGASADPASAADLAAVRHQLHDRVIGSEVRQRVLARLEVRVEATLEEGDITAPTEPYHWRSLLRLLAEGTEGANRAQHLRAAAYTLGQVYRSVVADMYQLQPALVTEGHHAALLDWISQQYPASTGQSLDGVQATRVAKDLAHYLNHKYPVPATLA